MEWIILLFIVLFVIGRMQRNYPGHPVNAFAGMTPNTPVVTGATSGDSFCGTTSTIAPGIPQPPSMWKGLPVPPHLVFPISPGAPPNQAPPPITIQTPKAIIPGSARPRVIGGGAGINTRVTPIYGMPRYRGY